MLIGRTEIFQDAGETDTFERIVLTEKHPSRTAGSEHTLRILLRERCGWILTGERCDSGCCFRTADNLITGKVSIEEGVAVTANINQLCKEAGAGITVR